MISYDYDWDGIFKDATKHHNPSGPVELLSTLGNKTDPWRVETELEASILQSALQIDLGVVYYGRNTGRSLSSEDRIVWVDRLAWLLQQLKLCRMQRPDFGTVAVILHVANAFSFDVPIWERIPNEFFSENLFICMASIVGATVCDFSSSKGAEPIWEREMVDRFVQADKELDWPTLETQWQTIATAFWPDADLGGAAACLCADDNGTKTLASVVDGFGSILQVINLAQTMSTKQIGKIAPLLKTSRCRFGFVQSLAFNQGKNEPLENEVSKNIAALCKAVQDDEREWEKWMIAFNRYPVRTKMLQPTFGLSLVGSSIEAKMAYLNAIQLSSSHGEGRIAVTNCLKKFGCEADPQERQEFWKLIFDRWSDWGFEDSVNEGKRLTWMAVSDLDFGVLGYLIENIEKRELFSELERAYKEMCNVRNNWYASGTSFRTSWYRALSKWQILNFAQQITNDQASWELPEYVQLPFDPSNDHFHAMTYPTNTASGPLD